ncbi:MAG: membrane protein insertion efficiency factor YidD [Thermoguttaceae bacterium]
MSTLRKSLTKPHFWLALVLVLAAAITWDSFRAPSRQTSARVYVALVRGYQRLVRPYLRGHVCCRFRPTCSEYSIEAVQQHGIATGLRLTVCRLCRCTGSVPAGTNDPVPVTP